MVADGLLGSSNLCVDLLAGSRFLFLELVGLRDLGGLDTRGFGDVQCLFQFCEFLLEVMNIVIASVLVKERLSKVNSLLS